MNTKAAVILMIGLLGSPVAYNFTQPVADDWVFYGGESKESSSSTVGIVLNRRTGQRFKVYDVYRNWASGKSEIPLHTLIAPPVDPFNSPPVIRSP